MEGSNYSASLMRYQARKKLVNNWSVAVIAYVIGWVVMELLMSFSIMTFGISVIISGIINVSFVYAYYDLVIEDSSKNLSVSSFIEYLNHNLRR